MADGKKAESKALAKQEMVHAIEVAEAAVAGGYVASGVASKILTAVAGEDYRRAVAEELMAVMLADLKPTSALERLLIEQMVVTHAQVLNLHRMAHKADRYDTTEMVANLAMKMQGEFRKSMKALKDWRTPVQPVIHAKQANVAQQQIIHNAPEPTNEQGGNDA